MRRAAILALLLATACVRKVELHPADSGAVPDAAITDGAKDDGGGLPDAFTFDDAGGLPDAAVDGG